MVRTLVKKVLVLLALGTPAGHAVDLVHETAATGRALLLGLLFSRLIVGVGATSELVNVVHFE